MYLLVSGVKRCTPTISSSIKLLPKQINQYELQSRCKPVSPSPETPLHRRHLVLDASISLITAITLNCSPVPLISWAGEEMKGKDDEDESVVGALKSLFDPNEKTKSGKVLPKAYLKSARDVVKNLRESLKENPKDSAKFRRSADAAKESIREYLSSWRGEKTVINEESYVEIEKAIRSLAGFYSKAGPSAPLPEVVKSEILNDLNAAEEFL